MNSFQVSPATLAVQPGTQRTLTISFHPCAIGLYSGAIKIRSNSGKTFTLLLRGEANGGQTDTENTPYRCSPVVSSTLHDDKQNFQVYTDPLMMKQQRMKEWLSRSSKTNTDIPPASVLYMDEPTMKPVQPNPPISNEGSSNVDNEAVDISVVPSTLRLLPLKKQIHTSFGAGVYIHFVHYHHLNAILVNQFPPFFHVFSTPMTCEFVYIHT